MTATASFSAGRNPRPSSEAKFSFDTPRLCLLLAAILSGLFAGFFVTYDVSVTRGLAEVDDATYVQSFQWINRTVQTPEFAVIFFGTIPALVAALLLNWRAGRPTLVLLAAAILFAVVTIGITAGANVPLNRELDVVDGLSPQIAAEARADFEDPWNLFNSIRTLTALVAACCATGALALRPTPQYRPRVGSSQ